VARTQVRGRLIIIGGHEAKDAEGDRTILELVAARAKRRKGDLLLIPVATLDPEHALREYQEVFHELGVNQILQLDVRSRDDASTREAVSLVKRASVIFFTGGDQLRITSQIGDSPVFQALQKRYRQGATVVGTSAGAAAMPETMLISGAGDQSHSVSTLGMAPGLGLIDGVVIDSHFAERGRLGRLLGAVAENPRNIGIGIDEDTAIVVEAGSRFSVQGSGAVYIVDGATVHYSSLTEQEADGVISIFGVRLHVLGAGDSFDLTKRQPLPTPNARQAAA
jgi:cyanophycinase